MGSGKMAMIMNMETLNLSHNSRWKNGTASDHIHSTQRNTCSPEVPQYIKLVPFWLGSGPSFLESLLWSIKDPERLYYVDAIKGGYSKLFYHCKIHRNYCACVALCWHSGAMCME